MARNIIQLAGGNFESLQALTGSDKLREREVVIAKDTNELFVGKADGSYALLGNVHMGENAEAMQNVHPQKGRFFFNEANGILYIANGTGWKKVTSDVTTDFEFVAGSGLEMDEETGEISVNVDDVSITINEEGKMTVKNTDYGEF